MASAVIPIGSKRRAQFSVLQLAPPGKAAINVGVLLTDPASGETDLLLREDWEEIADPDDVEYLSFLDADFRGKIAEMGGEALLQSLEDSLSGLLRISDRETVICGNFRQTLARLFDEHVEDRVRPYVTHLPLYSLQAAATKFGEESEIEGTGWVRAPADLRLTDGMFVARVVGRSMEPLIPDGSLCIFRAPVIGSRQGKRLLIEQFGAGSAARYTIKRYTSRKRQTSEEEWEHEAIRLEPLNPEFEAFELSPDEFRVIAEFVRVL